MGSFMDSETQKPARRDNTVVDSIRHSAGGLCNIFCIKVYWIDNFSIKPDNFGTYVAIYGLKTLINKPF